MNKLTEEAVDAAARALASLEPGEEWPSWGTSDHEYRMNLTEQERRETLRKARN